MTNTHFLETECLHVGIADAGILNEALEPDFRPEDLLPGCRCVVVLSLHIPDGALEIMRRGKMNYSYNMFGYAYLNRELDYLIDLLGRIRSDLGFTVERVEYGTGLAVDYFDENADALEEERLAAITPKLHELADCCELTVEMGRFFAAPCGYYLTKVVDVKTNAGINYAIVDGGLHQLKYDGQLQGMQIPVIWQLGENADAAEAQPWNICGSLCTTADVLVRSCELKELKIGDVLAFCRTGAYSCMEGMSIFLSRDLPAIALYSEDKGLELVREPLRADRLNTPILYDDLKALL